MTSELTTTSILSLFETNKSQRQSFALGVVDAITEGRVDPLKIHLQVKCMEDIIKLLNSNTIYKSEVLGAAEKMGQKTFEFQSSKFEIKETGVKYDYSKCDHPRLKQLYEEQEKLCAEIKDIEALLKTVPDRGMTIVEEDSGETYTVYPPAKSSTTSVAVTLK